MPTLDTFIFDVDGTLIDPRVGLTASMRYAFEKIGQPYSPEYDRGFFIGPAIGETLRELLPTDALAAQALSHYRDHFGTEGFAMCRVYDGIPELLARLAVNGRTLFVATARSQRFSDLLMSHFGLAPHFHTMYGTGMNGEFYDKAELVQHIVRTHALPAERTAIIGDRRYDIEAGHASGIHTIGVTYGYGTHDELMQAGAHRIAHSVAELAMVLS